jgi:hypothetical protein
MPMRTFVEPLIAVVLVTLLALASPVCAADCAAQANAPWRQAGNLIFVKATATGSACAEAKIVLVLQRRGGEALFTYEGSADTNFDFREVKTKAQMKAALVKWIADAMTQTPSSSQLPNWKDKENNPSEGEFPFIVEAGIARPVYLAIRKANRPTFCFVQGVESIGCLVLGADGAVTKVGVQSFPG